VTESVLLADDPKLNANWWRQATVYQIYPRSFADSNGDGIGDLAGVTSRIGYLAGLGIDAIWLSPFYPSALADGGYDVADYRNVAPELGTLEDFDALVAAAHAVGLKVIVDIVPNHTSACTHGSRRRSTPSRVRPLATGTSSATASVPTAISRRRTGSRTSVVRRGPGCPTGSGIATCSRPSSPT